MIPMPTYSAYGLTLELPFPCPVLPLALENTTPHVVVVDGTVPCQLAAPVVEDKMWQAEPGRFLWRGGPRSGRFLIEDGRRITLERNPAAEEELLASHFLDAVLAAVLRQRGMLVLHANAAVTPTGAVVVSGESGAGKSTTLAALMSRGCVMLADDITALRVGSDGRVQVLPGVPQLYLTEDAANGLGRDIAGLPLYRWQRMKAAVPAQANMATQPAHLRAIYLLRSHPCADVRVCELTGVEKFAAVQECVYGPLLPEEHPGQFPFFVAVTDQVAMYRIERPAGHWTVNDIVERILWTG